MSLFYSRGIAPGSRLVRCPAHAIMRAMRMAPVYVLLLLPFAAQAGLDDWLQERLGRSGANIDSAQAAAALKEALSQGTGSAVQQLGRENGFYAHPRFRIPVPEPAEKLDRTLRRLGRDKDADAFLLSMNRAAEAAVPEAKAVFLAVIRAMSVQDALGIVRGGDDAGTRYFRAHSEAALTQRFTPLVKSATDSVGATRRFKQLVTKYGAVARLADLEHFDLDGYVAARALDALYALVAEEERRIRTDPIARTSELLRQVFGAR